MSSNFPVVPVNPALPAAPRTQNEIIPWSRSTTQAINHLYRVLASYLTDALGGIGASLVVTSKVLSTSYTIPPDAGAYVPDSLEIASGVVLEVGAGATLEIG